MVTSSEPEYPLFTSPSISQQQLQRQFYVQFPYPLWETINLQANCTVWNNYPSTAFSSDPLQTILSVVTKGSNAFIFLPLKEISFLFFNLFIVDLKYLNV